MAKRSPASQPYLLHAAAAAAAVSAVSPSLETEHQEIGFEPNSSLLNSRRPESSTKLVHRTAAVEGLSSYRSVCKKISS
ncbi:hypothetical protein AAHA92_01753 [Salvia divinorum]|uniref:Secreted protein n=1 Tax=Salvia divinorum TaxID=28513 RepID=A0ABD1IBK6_SALDI